MGQGRPGWWNTPAVRPWLRGPRSPRRGGDAVALDERGGHVVARAVVLRGLARAGAQPGVDDVGDAAVAADDAVDAVTGQRDDRAEFDGLAGLGDLPVLPAGSV